MTCTPPSVVADCNRRRYARTQRYTHRVAVSNERIVGLDAAGVHLRVRADDHDGKRTVVIDGPKFIGAACSMSFRGPAINNVEPNR